MHTVIIGSGAVGGYTGGHLARAGFDITFVDTWPEHVETIRRDGVRVSGTQGDYTVKVPALHIADVQQLVRRPVDVAIIATKAFDTAWAARMIRDYLAPDGYVVSMQNSINEYRLAEVVGCVAVRSGFTKSVKLFCPTTISAAALFAVGTLL